MVMKLKALTLGELINQLIDTKMLQLESKLVNLEQDKMDELEKIRLHLIYMINEETGYEGGKLI